MNTEISVKTRWLVVLAAVVLVTGVSCGGEGNHPGGDPPPSLPTLSIASVNMANAVDFGGGANWQTRVDRLVTTIEGAQLVPDFISLTEIAGLWNCSTPPYRRAGDYDMIDRLLWRLDKRLSANYRVAYMVGVTGSVNNDFGTPLCWFHSGDALLYNPDRLVNLTPADVAGKAQERHDGPLLGTYIRRSLPICSRDTTLMPLEQLIDGPDQTDRCNTPTPSGPAWVQVDSTRGGGQTLVASLGRFSLRAAPGSSFDVVTSHLQSPEEVDHTGRSTTSSPHSPRRRSGQARPIPRGRRRRLQRLCRPGAELAGGDDAGAPALGDGDQPGRRRRRSAAAPAHGRVLDDPAAAGAVRAPGCAGHRLLRPLRPARPIRRKLSEAVRPRRRLDRLGEGLGTRLQAEGALAPEHVRLLARRVAEALPPA